jgi:ATP-dependent protease HslVU (ClpYQ) peptidase subunit
MIENGKVTIGGDSAGSNTHHVRHILNPKVFRNGEFIMGCTTSWRVMQLLEFSLKLPPVGDTEIYKYMCTTFIKKVRKCFEKGGVTDGATFLVGHKNRLFRVENNFQVTENGEGIDACGSGEEYGLGAMKVIKDLNIDESTVIKIRKALDVVSLWSPGVNPPYLFEETDK